MDEKTAKKIADLETTLGLMQHDFEAQNEMILLNTRTINQLQQTLTRLADKVELMKSDDPPRTLEDDRPPHY